VEEMESETILAPFIFRNFFWQSGIYVDLFTLLASLFS